ncbi:MAG TPA: histidine triad nucleotide-binding protein [Burkholderiales bacterium]|nr:histidine triad nucleotide-binding protein [Burkholderiales bacterium]
MSELTTSENCVFCKIVRGEIPAKKLYEDGEVLAFQDARPVAPVHLLLIPKTHFPSLYEAEDAAPVLGKLLALAPRIAREQGATDGFRTIINTGRVGRQEVYHLHIHVIGGPAVLGPMIARQ